MYFRIIIYVGLVLNWSDILRISKNVNSFVSPKVVKEGHVGMLFYDVVFLVGLP